MQNMPGDRNLLLVTHGSMEKEPRARGGDAGNPEGSLGVPCRQLPPRRKECASPTHNGVGQFYSRLR